VLQLSKFRRNFGNSDRTARDNKEEGTTMKKTISTLLALMMLLLCLGGAAADQKVYLPESRYSLSLPDGMEYDGPGEGDDDALFAYVSADLGLDIQFFRQLNDKGATLQAMTDVLLAREVDAAVYRISGVDMIAYRVTDPQDPPEKGMKCIAYVLLDGDAAQMICFWYANRKAADLSEKIISSIALDP